MLLNFGEENRHFNRLFWSYKDKSKYILSGIIKFFTLRCYTVLHNNVEAIPSGLYRIHRIIPTDTKKGKEGKKDKGRE